MNISDKVTALTSEGTLLPALLSTAALVAAQTARFRTQIDSRHNVPHSAHAIACIQSTGDKLTIEEKKDRADKQLK